MTDTATMHYRRTGRKAHLHWPFASPSCGDTGSCSAKRHQPQKTYAKSSDSHPYPLTIVTPTMCGKWTPMDTYQAAEKMPTLARTHTLGEYLAIDPAPCYRAVNPDDTIGHCDGSGRPESVSILASDNIGVPSLVLRDGGGVRGRLRV